ncbi:AfsR/SARP family transcriptional regulator [Actinoplanes couchii]|uniref:SARP family transcriptional regulator n=1 Tax=Actinoplanes couchii TaxID=403638 RepID=A0ABQ3XNR0_9ACTN|nr:AfsR/SARP family transcriptional regulator [Actinoplanes couchii]MDR6318015.1 DNA-binding SARP family transcriptional activator/tetratricopeptide (TPR) repeat protein [Actinoplanes couchii]GID60067.1 SARP family transcriptional regulator [Actinoplanes couchii]
MLIYRLLGTLEVRDPGGALLAIGRRKQRALLAMLVLRGGTVVRGDEIVEALWNGRPPSSARANLHSYVSDLRRVLPEALRTVPGGYRLDVAAGECDVTLFEALAAEGRRALDEWQHLRAAERLAHALGLWRGPLLEDLADLDWFAPFTARLTEARLTAVEDQAEARLALGEHAELAVELAARTAEHPLRERLWATWLRALHRNGERARALDGYRRMRSVLDAELGIGPGPALRELHREITGDAVPVPDARAGVVPALLPATVADFTAREDEARGLRKLLAPNAPPIAMTVAGITGMAGIGKTTLTVHVAHQVTAAYPDGQLYANLAGIEPAPATPGDVLGRFLRALGVPSVAVPNDDQERAELYRSLLAGRRALVVLDNAAGEAQVRPLLPGSATCAVLLTSRVRLSGLEGARWTTLDVLPGDDGVRLLERVAGEDRVAGDPGQARSVVDMCGGLPLAVRIAGARLTARPGWSLAHLSRLLRDERLRLDRLGAGDLQVRASLALSYAGLSRSGRLLFRRLGVFDVPDFPGWLAGVLADGADVDELVDAHMLTPVGVDAAGQLRYRFHDLVRLYAREETGDGGDDALDLGLGAWLAVAEHFEPRIPGPCFAPITSPAPRPDVRDALGELAGVDPLTWFDAEQATLRAAARQAGATGRHEAAYDLVQRLEKYFDVRGMYAEWVASSRPAMAACTRAGDRRGAAVMRRGLIDVQTWIAGDRGGAVMDRALTDAGELLAMFRDAGEPGGMADAAAMRSVALTALGRPGEAVEAAEQALDWAGQCGHLGGLARGHVALAVALGESGRLPPAVENLHLALARARELGNPRWEATALQFLGIGHSQAGLFDASEGFLTESLAISRRHRDAYTEALTMIALARLRLLRGDDEARPAAEAALATAREYRMNHHIADALAILGEIELNRGRYAEAVAHLRESVAIWRTRGWLRFLAGTLILLGRALGDRDPVAARAALGEAEDLCVRVGDQPRADETRQLRCLLHGDV